MYAIVETGGKQVRAELGKTIRVERLSTPIGEHYRFDNVLLVANDSETVIGTPHVESSPVIARVTSHGRGKKIRVIKMKRRKNYKRTQGHRQDYTELEILSIRGVVAPEAVVSENAKSKSADEQETEIESIPESED